MLYCKANTWGKTATIPLPVTSAIFVLVLKNSELTLPPQKKKKIGAFTGELTK